MAGLECHHVTGYIFLVCLWDYCCFLGGATSEISHFLRQQGFSISPHGEWFQHGLQTNQMRSHSSMNYILKSSHFS